MAMKKTSGGDSSLRQGAEKSFWTLPISGRRRRRIVMCSRKLIGYLGFSRRGVFIGEVTSSEVDQGDLTHRGAARGWAAPPWCVGPLWPYSVSSSVLWKLRWISGCLAFVSSNSDNISCVTFLKHKNSRKRETGTVATC
jgi:hypothetical protein